MKKRTVSLITIATILTVLAFLAGCALEPDRVTRENYDLLKLGMTFEAVTEIMGEPQHASTQLGAKEYTWVNGDKQIHAKFLFNSAVYYSSKGLGSVGKAASQPSGH